MWKNITLGGPHLSEGGVTKSAPPVHFFFFLTLPLGKLHKIKQTNFVTFPKGGGGQGPI